MLVNFSWIREGAVAGMGFPGPDAWAALADQGVGAVLSLTERAPQGDPAKAGLETLHVPLRDFGTPDTETLRTCTTWIDAQIAAGRPVAVHCMAGQGRTGTILAAWLTQQGLSATEAVAEVRRLRPYSIETRGQEQAVAAFAAAAPAAGEGAE